MRREGRLRSEDMIKSHVFILLFLLPVAIYSCLFNACQYQFCQNRSNCSLDENCNPVCDCQPGYSGTRCDVEDSKLSESNCSLCPDNHVCTESNGNWSCEVISSTSSPGLTTPESNVTEVRNISQDVCSANYRNQTLSDRRCLGFECVYGKCNKSLENIDGIQTLIAKCDCDSGATGLKCEFQCCLDCGHGFCQYSISDGEPFCNCEPEYTGEQCQELRPNEEGQVTDPFWIWWLVGGCTLAFLLLLLLLVAIPYCLWKKRVLVVMKIAYFFQPYEENDDKEWDAFVSYKSSGSDEDFVLKKLQPVLEDKFGFRLCLHYRDFVIGAAIFENIIEAINNSRRTILVLSPRFLSSEWTRYEYQVALQEMLKKKHRIIPVILEDISDIENIDETLKQILSSITYIKWPDSEKNEKHFWKTLRLSLPKKREESGGSSTQTDVSDTDLPVSDQKKINNKIISDKSIKTLSTEETSALEDVTVDFCNESFLYQNIDFANENKKNCSNNCTVICDQVYHF